MAISAYPRTAIQGTPGAGNPSNGLSLMLLNPSTGNYEAATSSTFAGGGGGGGDATAANQVTQINIENDLLLASDLITNNTLNTVNSVNDVNFSLLDSVSGGNSLRDLLNLLKQINGGVNGSYYQSSENGTVTGLTVEKIVINDDAVLTRLEDTAGSDLLTLYGLSGKTLKQGSVIVTNGIRINVVRVGSGSILRYGL